MKSSLQIFTGIAVRRLLAGCALMALTGLATFAQETTGTPGSPSATSTIDGKYLPASSSAVRRRNQLGRHEFEALLASDGRSAERGAECVADPHRRCRLRRAKHFRRLNPYSGPGPHCECGFALHAIPFDGAVFADSRGLDHRTQPPFGWFWRHRGNLDRLSRLQQRHHQGQGDHRHDPRTTATPPRGLARTTTRRRPGQSGRPVRSVAHRHGV